MRGRRTVPARSAGLIVVEGDSAAAHGEGGSAAGRAGLLRSVFDESPIAILRVARPPGGPGIVLDANPAAAALLDRPLRDVLGCPLDDLIPGVDSVTASLTSPGRPIRLPVLEGSGDRWAAVSISPLSASDAAGHPLQLVILHDVTDQWTTRARLDRQAREDPLTGLINRGELLRQIAEVTDESGGPHVAIIFVDLDGFKMVNDTRGHQVGDELLIAVARRIRAAVRPEDSLARIGGDEFVVLCPRLAEPQEVQSIAERVRATLDQPVTVEGRSHRISMSVGIALARADAIDPADLLRQADMAMYRAKDAGRNTVRVHSVEMDEELETAERIRESLGVALEVEAAADGETAGLVLHYQPIVEIATGRVAYVEALARLRLSGGGLVYPSQFLPVAARAGLNGALSEQVLRRALGQRSLWRHEGVDVPVGLNLARGQVNSASFAADALRIIAEQSDVPAGVVFEMGEFGLLEATGPAQLTLRRLRASGIGLAIDHFGTGYSSLGALRFLGPHRVKIDRSFVSSITASSADRAIVAAAVSAAHALGQKVVAEGVESRQQLDVLRELGCDEAQGYLIAQVLEPGALGLATVHWRPVTLERIDGPAAP
ncbi:MAG: EAL domain-containing protein [Candidatus Nanopelagicales bacterium]|jgi:diguanylate cyclase (GGDEF)-like protein|nr:EAL domain-containing protein [Candidatus Nanopelagicales bacterium]